MEKEEAYRLLESIRGDKRISEGNPWKYLGKNEYFLLSNPLVILIGCSEYEGDWTTLNGAKEDLRELKSLFEEFYGWKVRCLCENVTKKAITKCFERARAELVISEEDPSGLLLFLCGHGTMGSFVACEDPGQNEKDEKKLKRLRME